MIYYLMKIQQKIAVISGMKIQNDSLMAEFLLKKITLSIKFKEEHPLLTLLKT